VKNKFNTGFGIPVFRNKGKMKEIAIIFFIFEKKMRKMVKDPTLAFSIGV